MTLTPSAQAACLQRAEASLQKTALQFYKLRENYNSK